MANKREEYLSELKRGSIYGVATLNIILLNAFGSKAEGLADRLLKRFPGVTAVLDADYDELIAVEGITKEIAAYLKCVRALSKECGFTPSRIESAAQFKDLVAHRLGEAANEFIEIYFTDGEGRIKEIRTFTSDKLDRAETSVREILTGLIADGVKRVYFSHNHVACSSSPSLKDDSTTKKLAAVCTAFGVELYEHVIVGEGGATYSYRESGKLKE